MKSDDVRDSFSKDFDEILCVWPLTLIMGFTFFSDLFFQAISLSMYTAPENGIGYRVIFYRNERLGLRSTLIRAMIQMMFSKTICH